MRDGECAFDSYSTQRSRLCRPNTGVPVSADSDVLSKIAEVTLFFWVIKVLATTLGGPSFLELAPAIGDHLLSLSRLRGHLAITIPPENQTIRTPFIARPEACAHASALRQTLPLKSNRVTGKERWTPCAAQPDVRFL